MGDINNLLGRLQKCDTQTHNYCNKMVDNIMMAMDNNSKINPTLLCNFIYGLFGAINNNYSDPTKCAIINETKIINLLNNIFEKIPDIFKMLCDKIYMIKELLQHPNYDSCYNYLNNIPKLNSNTPSFGIFIRRITSRYGCENDDLINFIITNTIITEEILKKLIICKNNIMAKYISNIIDKSDYKFDNKDLSNACSVLPFSKPIIYALNSKGLELNNKHIHYVIENCSTDSIEFIFNIVNPKITKNHFSTLVMSSIEKYTTYCSANTIIYSNGNVYRLNNEYDTYGYEDQSNYSKEKMSIFLNRGFIPDKNDILLSVQYKVEIPMIEKFVNLDETFLKLCIDNNFYPKYNFNCISPELLELRSLCVSKNLPKIRNLLNKHKTVPDNICMEYASKVKGNDKALQLLINAGGIITPQCIKLYSSTINDAALNVMANSLIANTKKT